MLTGSHVGYLTVYCTDKLLHSGLKAQVILTALPSDISLSVVSWNVKEVTYSDSATDLKSLVFQLTVLDLWSETFSVLVQFPCIFMSTACCC